MRVRSQQDWLSKRFDLFESFCLPTVVSQRNQNFIWIVYFDDHTPPEFRTRIEGYRRHAFFRPYYVNYEEMSCYRNHICDLFLERPKWLLTTTLDNDDGWHREFIPMPLVQVGETSGSAACRRSANAW
jgi:hypothetical protein